MDYIGIFKKKLLKLMYDNNYAGYAEFKNKSDKILHISEYILIILIPSIIFSCILNNYISYIISGIIFIGFSVVYIIGNHYRDKVKLIESHVYETNYDRFIDALHTILYCCESINSYLPDIFIPDKNGNYNCVNCEDCYGCICCEYCKNCQKCVNCDRLYLCDNCYDCVRCIDSSYLIDCCRVVQQSTGYELYEKAYKNLALSFIYLVRENNNDWHHLLVREITEGNIPAYEVYSRNDSLKAYADTELPEGFALLCKQDRYDSKNNNINIYHCSYNRYVITIEEKKIMSKKDNLEIISPEGYTHELREDGKIYIVPNKEKIKSWKDIPRIKGYFITPSSYIGDSDDIPANANKNVVATKKQAESVLAYAQLTQILKELNDGWIPNWKNLKEDKYCIIYNAEDDELDLIIRGILPVLLAFKTKKIRTYFMSIPEFVELAKMYYKGM